MVSHSGHRSLVATFIAVPRVYCIDRTNYEIYIPNIIAPISMCCMLERFAKTYSISFEIQAKTSPKRESALGRDLPSIYI
jgi:hypothetical protein